MLDIDIKLDLGAFSLDMAENIPTKGITAIFGPSGSGKTTILKLIAGFLRPDEGRILFANKAWVDQSQGIWVVPHRRPVGTLFQDGRLFSHMTVQKNLEFADKRSHPKENSYGLDDVIQATDIGALLSRRPHALSGGEIQRVALARTLLSRPQLLLFDEPLSALDRARKRRLLPFLETLPKIFDIPAIYVSHDVDEVSQIADHALILDNGRVNASGLAEPTLAKFGFEAGRNPYEIGSLLTGKVTSHDPEFRLSYIKVGTETLSIPLQSDLMIGAAVTLRISPRDIALSKERVGGLSIQNILKTTILSISEKGTSSFCDISLMAGDQILTAQITRKSANALGLGKGQTVYALIKSAIFQP